MKLTLKKPLQFGSETISELEFREATTKDFRDMPLEPKIGDFLDVAGKLCGRLPAEMNLLSPTDMMAVIGIVGNSFAPGLETGAKG